VNGGVNDTRVTTEKRLASVELERSGARLRLVADVSDLQLSSHLMHNFTGWQRVCTGLVTCQRSSTVFASLAIVEDSFDLD
jgi:hypothetical protein